MRTFGRYRRPFAGMRPCQDSVTLFAELAFEVTREHRMDGDGMHMTRFAVMRVRFGMNVEQRQGEQTEHHPSTETVIEPGCVWVTGVLDTRASTQTLS